MAALTAATAALTIAVSCERQAAVSGEASPAAPPPAPATGAPGVFDDRIVFGQSAAFSGPASELGTQMNIGMEAAFQEANRAGGVHGRSLELVSEDDSYEPNLAFASTMKLVMQHRVFALIGAVGTPTSRAAAPVATRNGVPYVAPFTGAEFLRAAEMTNVVNLRASYYQETERMVQRLTQDLDITRVAVLYQNDTYGGAGYEGVRRALAERNLEPVAHGYYTRNTRAVKTGVFDVTAGDPEAIIMIGAYGPVAEAISLLGQSGAAPVIMSVSFVGSEALAAEVARLGAWRTGIYVTQVVPHPADDANAVVASYLAALAAYDAEATPTFVSLEGYLVGRLAVAGLESCGREVTRACFLAAYRGRIDLDGFPLDFSDDNQGSDAVFLTTLGADGAYRQVDTLSGAGQ